MTPRLSKFMLTAHIALSVGWLGAVAGFLVLSIASLTSRNGEIVRGAYISMNLIGRYAIVPLSFAALLTGLVQSLGSSWGLFRQYWTAIKFGLTVGAVFLLLLHEFGNATRLARYVLSLTAGVLPDAGSIGSQLAVEAAFAVLVLVITTVLSVYKPWGLTRYGWRIQQRGRVQLNVTGTPDRTALSGSDYAATHALPLGLKIFLAMTALLVGLFAASHHLGGHGPGHHHSETNMER
jgi:hypothetical protein